MAIREEENSISGSEVEKLFEQVYRDRFEKLHAYAHSMIREEAAAEEVVQQVFYKLWAIKDRLDWSSAMTPYLYRAVHNESLNLLKYRKVKATHEKETSRHPAEAMTEDPLAYKELQVQLVKAMNTLPEQCRTVFQMSRYEELKYREIADRLNISVKTVENHMSKALKILREKLAAYLPVLCLLFINWKK
jgi:RNA polymerase sigma-70 factor (ECF subfamily)